MAKPNNRQRQGPDLPWVFFRCFFRFGNFKTALSRMFFLPSSVLVLLRVFPKAKGISQLRFISTSDDSFDFCCAALHMVFRQLVT